mgnify:CR=1 FL=1
MTFDNEICVFGAGSIGCYLGGRLQAAGYRVRLIGRPRLAAEIARHGLRLSDYRGADFQLPPERIRYSTDPADATGADLVLVTVKSAATEQAARELAPVLKPSALVVSFQNGVGNAELLRRHLPAQTVLTGMVPFNVVQRGEGRFHQGSGGDLMAQPHARLAPFRAAFERAGLPLHERADIVEVQWAKLLLNLNNAINALSDLPLKTELSQRAYRRCLALAQGEALRLYAAAGIRPARITPLPPRLLPLVLSLPDGLFQRLARRMLAIDPLARSSTWEDLQAGRKTEIDWINGEIVRLAQRLGRAAPVNARLVALIREAENGQRRPWSGPELLAQLRAAARQPSAAAPQAG